MDERQKISEAQKAYENNEPPVAPNQVWASYVNGTLYRKIRILAAHPDPGKSDGKRQWIYCDLPGGKLRTSTFDLRICPEFNLRYIFTLEGTYDG